MRLSPNSPCQKLLQKLITMKEMTPPLTSHHMELPGAAGCHCHKLIVLIHNYDESPNSCHILLPHNLCADSHYDILCCFIRMSSSTMGYGFSFLLVCSAYLSILSLTSLISLELSCAKDLTDSYVQLYEIFAHRSNFHEKIFSELSLLPSSPYLWCTAKCPYV